MNDEDIKQAVRQRYGEAALQATAGTSSCCSKSPQSGCDPITADLYSKGETESLPAEAVLASFGCGNPTALAQLNPGEIVLDLGSGGGIDVLLSARRVGSSGRVYGLDMTDEMLALARENQRRAGIENAEFLKGDMEAIPLPDNSVDVGIDRVLAEAFRVLKPGGRFAVSDVVIRGSVPDALRGNIELCIGCVAGALEEQEYRRKLNSAGFLDISIEPTRVYRADDARAFLAASGLDDPDAVAQDVDGKFMSAFVRARKPVGR